MSTKAVLARLSRRLGGRCAPIFAAIALLASGHSAYAVSDTDLKVAYLFNFASLVNWPSSSFSGPQSPLVIGFVGNNSIAEQFERRIGDRTAKGRPIVVRRVSAGDGAAMRDCHVLYFGDSDPNRLDGILRQVQGTPVLTVSDGTDFVRRGGVIAFEVQDKTVRFTANMRSASANGLSLGSDVLRLAREVISR